MANVAGKNATGSTIYLKATGAGSDVDPNVPEHLETNSSAIKTAVESTSALLTNISGSVDGIEDQIGATNETVASSDTATSGLNGLTKRLLQRITTLIALLPTALTGSGNFKVAIQEPLPAGTSAIGKLAANSGVDIGDVDVTSISAGENHIGEVSGGGKVVTPSVTVSTSPAYTSGDSIGGKWTLPNAVRVNGGVSILTSITILDRANQKPVGSIFVYNADPSAATLTDNAALANSTDDQKVIAIIPVVSGDWTTVNNKAYANLSALAREVQAASGTTLYASWVTTSTPTFAATTDVQPAFGFVYVN